MKANRWLQRGGTWVDMVDWNLETLRDDGYTHYLDYSDGFMGIFIY